MVKRKHHFFAYTKKPNLTAVCKELGAKYNKAYRKLKSIHETGFRKNGGLAFVLAVVD